MSDIEPCAKTPVLNWSELGVSHLPSGTVTLLLADVEGSTRLWESRPDEMAAAVALLDSVLPGIVAKYDGVRPLEQGEGDSFVVAFARASDAAGCAMELQRAPLAPIRLRIGVHSGEIQLRDDDNYIGPTINRTARLRDLAHGGQTVLSGATEQLVVDRLPDGTWLIDLGTHALRDLPRPERVVQLCHPDLINDFPPLRTSKTVANNNLPTQLTSFIGRDAELAQLRELVTQNRVVTLTGAGGVGKTRIAIQLGAQMSGDFGDGVCYVDLAPITDPELVPITVAQALGLPDQPGRSTMTNLLRFMSGRQMLMVLDNCEHLLDSSAELLVAVVSGAPGLRVLATSREAIGAAGELSWRVPSLSLTDQAIALFNDRARHVRPDFTLADDDATVVREICARLDGVPLAIELAAARVRALTLAEILDSLHDRFRLLTGGARTAVRRQQTLRASVDWSHALLTEPERVLFRRLAVFMGGFDLVSAQAVAGVGDVERFQVLDQLSLLVDKSLVGADESGARTRYRLLETVRQYALERLGESGEADVVRTRHRDHYTSTAASLDAPAGSDFEQRIEQANAEIDNLRTAFAWSRENSELELAFALASSLQPLWQARGRLREGLNWFDVALSDLDAHPAGVTSAARARALADSAALGLWVGVADSVDRAQQALAIARDVGDPALLVRALTACGYLIGYYDLAAARAYLDEAIGLALEVGDRWRLCQILAAQSAAAMNAGDPVALRDVAESGRDLADEIGDRFTSRRCRWCLAFAQMVRGDLVSATALFAAVTQEAEAARDEIWLADGLSGQGMTLAYRGEIAAASVAANAAVEVSAELGRLKEALAYSVVAVASLAAGDAAAALVATDAAREHMTARPIAPHTAIAAQSALATGDLITARHLADEAVATNTGAFLSGALTTRCRVAIAQGEPDQAERDAHDALACGGEVEAYLFVSDGLECLASLRELGGSHRDAVRLYGAADAARHRTGAVRYKIYDADYENSVAASREALGESEFDVVWAEGAALSIEESIAYAHRGRGQRKRPASGWGSLTPTECDVVRLVSDGLGNKDIGTRLFISPRTVQTHLTHVYAKLGLTSRVQLVQEAARHT